MKLNELLSEHVEAKAKLDEYKNLEKELRLRIINKMFPSAGEGTHTEIVAGLEVKATMRMNYKIDTDSLELLEEVLTDDELRCIKRNPSLNLTNYRQLDDSERINLDGCIEVTPGLPSLSIKEQA